MAGSPPPGGAAAIKWAVHEIRQWRDEAGIPWSPDPQLLRAVLDRLQASGVPQALTAYVILGCEWLLRVAKVATPDVEVMLSDVERGLAQVMPTEYAYWLVETLRDPLARKIRSEGRKLLSLGVWVPMSEETITIFETQPRKRERPARLVPPSRGRIPWPAPWVAGAIVREMLVRRSSGPGRHPLDLTQALYGRRRVEPIEFKTQTRGLTAKALEWWLDAFERRYSGWLDRTADDADDWASMWKSHLAVFGVAGVFPCDAAPTRQLMHAYGSIGRRSPKTSER